MKNFYTVEKFKQSFDSEGNEILTKIDAAENLPEITASNALNNRLNNSWFTNSTAPMAFAYSNGVITFNNYNLAVCQSKFATQSAYFDGSTNDWTLDSTYDLNDKAIIGARFSGEDNSVPTGTDIVVHTMRNRFSAPTTTIREINTIFLGVFTGINSNYDQSLFSAVVLDVPCFQDTDEVLIITYRYTYNRLAIAQNLPMYDSKPDLAFEYAQTYGMFSGNSFALNPFGVITDYNIGSSRSLETGKTLLGDYSGDSTTNFAFYDGVQYYNSEGVAINDFSLTVNDLVGKLLSTIQMNGTTFSTLITNDTRTYSNVRAEVRLRRPTDTVVQNTFNKIKKTADPYESVSTPFYSISDEGSSLGALTLSDSFGSNETSYDIIHNVSELVRTEITTGGVAGTAEYKISTRLLSSFFNSSGWISERGSFVLAGDKEYSLDEDARILNMNYEINTFGLVAMWQQMASKLLQPLAAGEFVIFTDSTNAGTDGLHIHTTDLTNVNFPYKLDSVSQPSFTATDIRGITTAEDGTMYVACADTGLWRVTRNIGDLAASVVCTLVTPAGVVDATSCHAINFARYGNRFNSDAKLVALFGAELCISTDSGATWVVYNAGTTPAYNAGLVLNDIIGISSHPDHDEVIIITTTERVQYVQGNIATLLGSVKNGVAHQWFGATGTILTNSARLGAISIAHHYGAGNCVCRAASNTGTYKWIAEVYTSNSSTKGFNGFNNINDSGNVLKSPTGNLISIELLYDDLADDSVAVFYQTSPQNALCFEYIENLVANTLTNDRVITIVNDVTYFILMGRGLFLGGGGINNLANYTSTNLTTDGSNSFLSLASIFHFGSMSNPDYDFYEGNPLNVWYPYGWDGSNWILEGTGSKVSSAAQETLIKGIDIQFTNDVAAPTDPLNYIITEVFDTYLFDGIVKDDYTSLSLESYTFIGLTVTGNDFFPATVPATPAGVSTTPIGTETWQFKEQVGFGINGIAYDEKNISTLQSYTTTVPVAENIAQLTPTLAAANFNLGMKIGVQLNGPMIDLITINYRRPTFTLNDASTVSFDGGGTAILGVRVGINPANLSSVIVYVWEENVQVASVALATYNPKTDIFSFVRDNGTSSMTLQVNGVIIHTFTYLVIASMELKGFFYAVGSTQDTTLSTNIAGNGNDIKDMVLTFNDQRLISRIGNGSTTGRWAENYGRMSSLELVRGVKKIYLDGVEAAIIYDFSVDEPAAGQVKINTARGELLFNVADAGKTITGDWRFMPALNQRT